jgi:hypothetical protein
MDTAGSSSIGPELAALVRAHLDELAAHLAEAARRQIALYRNMDDVTAKTLFTALYQVLAQTFEAGDISPMRMYLQRVTADRIRDGVQAAAFIRLAELSEEFLGGLIMREWAAHPQKLAEGLRREQAINSSVRLILSEINLQLLARPDTPPRGVSG